MSADDPTPGVEWTAAEWEAVCEAVAVHTPELVALAPDGVSEGQHLYCVQCGVLPVDALALQHGPEHVAEHVAIALAPFSAGTQPVVDDRIERGESCPCGCCGHGDTAAEREGQP